MNYIVSNRKLGLDEKGNAYLHVVVSTKGRALLVELSPEDIFILMHLTMRPDFDSIVGAVVTVEEGEKVTISHPIESSITVTGKILDVKERGNEVHRDERNNNPGL